MPKLLAGFTGGGKLWLGKTFGDKLRAISWHYGRGVLSYVVGDENGNTWVLELTKADLSQILTYYTAGNIVNHFGGDQNAAENWLQTSRKILLDPENRLTPIIRPKSERSLPLRPVRTREDLDKLLRDSQQTQRFLWFRAGLRDAIREIADKIPGNVRKAGKPVKLL